MDHLIDTKSIDFRPDYKKLGSLKTLFPNVPIQAVVGLHRHHMIER
jgi:superfamily II DNA helicase RecQ